MAGPHPALDPVLRGPYTIDHATSGGQDGARSHDPAPAPLEGAEDPLLGHDLAFERAQTWTGLARFGFNAMLASPGHKNKTRLNPDKLARISEFLVNPNTKSRERDPGDAQMKHQSQQWLLSSSDGRMYRRPDPTHPQMRQHVGAREAFDILTAEHLRGGHCGRDKMLKSLEARYIGYTKDEVMYVLHHCLVCSERKVARGAAAKRRGQNDSTERRSSTVVDDVDLQRRRGSTLPLPLYY